ncbi:glycosyltransferase family 28 protein [Ancylostoma caninum]|uniref:glucuronosyltransferase n=1 Tax=Ancylostoma caninum TaxID=29170 RepID=A0A368FTV4_ANCCA|nr:glycosyltransferase family 28 protein [Ancylostoma caninum]
MSTFKGFSGAAFEEFSLYEEQKGLLEYGRAYNELCEDLINRDNIMDQLRAEHFDGYFGEQINLCGNGMAHALGIKSHFWVSSCPVADHMAWVLGMPQPSSYIPSLVRIDVTNKMSYLERVQNIYSTFLYVYFVEKSVEETTEPYFEEMEKGEKGVVFFSFGTVVNTTLLPKFAMTAVIETVKQTPDYHFIVAVDTYDQFTRELSKDVPNVYVCTWAPQPAILKHTRLRAFITHGGYNSVMEASRAAVPLITIPFLFDQTRNSRAVELNGWGIPLNKRLLRDDPRKLTSVLHELLSNEKYKEAATRISTLIRTKPFNASERLVKFTEFVLSNGGMKELLVEGRKIPFMKYHNLDIFVPLGVVFVLACWASLRLFTMFFARIAFQKVKVQ